MRVCLDHNATSPLRPEARCAVLEACEITGNASSVHADGRAARHMIENARARVAHLLGVAADDVVFTSGGSEGATMLLVPGLAIGTHAPVERLIVSAIEHSAILSGGRFLAGDITTCPVDSDGIIDLEALFRLLATDQRPALVALMAANNETGVLQPVSAAAEMVHAKGGTLVCDAVQAAGKLDIGELTAGADALIVSGHKLGAPQGVGAVAFRSSFRGAALIKGGGQENRQRAGTENLIGIAGFGAAAEAVTHNRAAETIHMAKLQARLETGLAAMPWPIRILGQNRPRLPNTTAFTSSGTSGETTLIACDLAGLSVSTGSACSSGKVAASHVLAAMGIYEQEARSMLRVSSGWSSREEDIEHFLAVWQTHRARIAARHQAA